MDVYSKRVTILTVVVEAELHLSKPQEGKPVIDAPPPPIQTPVLATLVEGKLYCE